MPRPGDVAKQAQGVPVWLRGVGLLAIILSPLVVHHALTGGAGTEAAIGVAAVQMAVLASLVLRGIRRVVLAPLAAVLMLAAGNLAARPSLVAAAAVSHAALYVLLLAVFAGSLRPGARPVAERLARRIHGTLTPARLAYTRKVTWLWTGFFTFELAGAALLLATGHVRLWSLFVNVLDVPLALLLALVELAVRAVVFRGQAHGTPADMLRAFAGRGVPR
jgi:uncharacterized membrane protein